jgi:ribosomal protein S18 acetylase RimI-like enzyme
MTSVTNQGKNRLESSKKIRNVNLNSNPDPLSHCALTHYCKMEDRTSQWLVGLLLVLLSLACSDGFVIPNNARRGKRGFDGPITRRRCRFASSTRPSLFFRPVALDKSVWNVPKSSFEKASSTDLPWTIELESSKPSAARAPKPVLHVRALRTGDIPSIAEMCVKEYGSSVSVSPFSFIETSAEAGNWFDREGLRLLVDVTSRLKVQDAPKDHAILVSMISDGNDQFMVGMVEISRQPVIYERNPPPYAIPLFMKQAYASLTKSKLQGWITNLLVEPEYRGRGHAKVLVAACEAMAKSWRLDSIHLHCDSDELTGRVSQKLYMGLGYRPLPSDESFSWMRDFAGTASNSVFMVQGVPLLYLRKDLR